MTGQFPSLAVPKIDNTVTVGPAHGQTCFSAQCVKNSTRATVVVTFGMFADISLWRESQGKEYPMCDADADQTIGYLRERRPEIAIVSAFADVLNEQA